MDAILFPVFDLKEWKITQDTRPMRKQSSSTHKKEVSLFNKEAECRSQPKWMQESS